MERREPKSPSARRLSALEMLFLRLVTLTLFQAAGLLILSRLDVEGVRSLRFEEVTLMHR